MSNLQVWQKVVCIETPTPCPPWHSPVAGEVYTVRGFVEAGVHIGVYLEEVRNPKFDWSRWGYPEVGVAEPAFVSTFFRPVVERKTDISIFQAMLTPKQVQVEVA